MSSPTDANESASDPTTAPEALTPVAPPLGYPLPVAPPQGYPMPVFPAPVAPPAPAAPAPQGNGFAVAALILGILPCSLLGVVFGILGLVKSKTTGTGRGMSIAGIVLSIVWLFGSIGGGIYFYSKVSDAVDQITASAAPTPHTIATTPAPDPACVEIEKVFADDNPINSDASSPEEYEKNMNAAIDQLTAAAAMSNNPQAQVAIKAVADDFKELVDSVTNGKMPSDALKKKLQDDAVAVDAICAT